MEQNGNIIACLLNDTVANEKLTGRVRLLTPLNKPFYGQWNLCKEKNYCHNHGMCYQDPDNDGIKICT